MAMISGAVVSTALTLVAVPLLYFELHRRSTPILSDDP
jgi:hypothetical protein